MTANGASPVASQAVAPEQSTADKPLLDVRNLVMHFPLTQGIIIQRKVGAVQAVDGVSFSVKKGETLGLVGESGCGKSTTGRAILQLYKPTSGEVVFNGQTLTRMSDREMQRIRGPGISMIFQEPMTSLNPVFSIGDQIMEILGIRPGPEVGKAYKFLLELRLDNGPMSYQDAREALLEWHGRQA